MGGDGGNRPAPTGQALQQFVNASVERIEGLGVSHLLIAQRWWGSGREMEASSLDALAMTSWFAARSHRLQLITAIHPGFFQPAPFAKWAATMDVLTGGRWSINVTSGWHLAEFDMYGVDALEHDQRYARTAEFIDILRGAWESARRGQPFTCRGRWFSADALQLEPRPVADLTVFQGGQSAAAIELAASRSDWMFLNGGSLERIGGIIERVRAACAATGRRVRFAMYANPLCRSTDAAAWAEVEARLAALDPALVARRRAATGGATGMWADDDERLAALDTNEGFAARLIGTPERIVERLEAYRALGVDMLHVNLGDEMFETEVLPRIHAL